MLFLSRIAIGVSIIFGVIYLSLHNHPYWALLPIGLSIACATTPLIISFFSKNRYDYSPLACKTGCVINLLILLAGAMHW